MEAAMVAAKLREFLDGNGVKYMTISHAPAFTANEIAASAHVPGRDLAKTVMVRMDGVIAMAVVPATNAVDFDALRAASGAARAELAGEAEFGPLFPGCDVGAMPPFGNLYGMKVYADEALADEEQIAFNAGTHTAQIRMSFAEFERLVQPTVADISDPVMPYARGI
jgi:Ala-tRNA(Pro) deacylase